MRRLAKTLAASTLFASGSAMAADFTLGGRIGLPGIGIELGTKLTDYVGIRANLTGLAYNLDFEYDDVDYDVETRVSVGSVLLDIYPMGGKFRITAGGAYYNNKGDISATPSPGYLYQIGSNYYSSAAIGTLNGSVEYKTGAPYLGFGFDFMSRKRSGFGVTVDVGFFYVGKPDEVTLTSTGGGVSAADLALERQNIKDDAATFDLAVGVGLYYRF